MAGADRTLIAMDEFTDSTSWVSSLHSEHLGCIPSRPCPEGGGRNAGRSQRQTSRSESKSGERPTEETKGAKSAQATSVAGNEILQGTGGPGNESTARTLGEAD